MKILQRSVLVSRSRTSNGSDQLSGMGWLRRTINMRDYHARNLLVERTAAFINYYALEERIEVANCLQMNYSKIPIRGTGDTRHRALGNKYLL